MIALPDFYKDNAIGTCLILDRGSKCHSALQINTWVMIDHVPKKDRIIINSETGDFLIDESKIIGVIYRNKKLIPLGDTVLIQRDLTVQYEGAIALTPNVTQNREGWIRAVGLLPYGKKRRRSIVDLDARCYLSQWEPTMKEFHYNGCYYVIAESKDILFQWN